MASRMDRYQSEKQADSRTNRNKDIYYNLSEKDLENISITDNESIISTNTTNIDIEKLQSLLDNKYRKNTNLRDYEYVEDIQKDLENTKEYDLKKELEHARKNKPENYDIDRFKKLRTSEYEILNSLNINKDDEEKEKPTKEETELLTLIKTVNENAEKRHPKTEQDLMDDLLGDDNTEVLEPIEMDDNLEASIKKPTIVEELEKTRELSKTDIKNAEKTEKDTPEKIIENSFYTGNLAINENDLEDFKDLQKELKSSGILIKIIIIAIIIIVLAAAVYFLNKYLHLELF